MTDFQKVCRIEELEEGRGHEARVNHRPVALFRKGDRVFALEDRCPHREGQLSRGHCDGGDAVCPLHGWNFDLETGVSPYNPKDAIATYPVQVRDGAVYIDADAVPPLPATTFDGYQARWRRWYQDARGHYEVRRLAKGKPPLVEAMGALPETLSLPVGFDHFHLRAGQLARMPRLKTEAVATGVILGVGAGRPLELAVPAYVSHMSFGALGREAKIALARGARAAGTAIGSGEGGMLPEEREAAGPYILEMASGYFGWNEQNIGRADAVEIKVGQSAKPGLGGELPAGKVTAEIAEVRGLEAGQDAVSPARFTDIEDLEALGRRIAWLRAGWPDLPVGIKVVASDVEADLAAALALAPDFITLDGFGGGTGAAPVHIREQFGLPIVQALPRARLLVDRHNAAHPERPVSLVATGTLRTPADVIKALALGADACALATASLFALGCEYYRACDTGECPVGITTHDPELRERLDVDTAAERVAHFFQGTAAVLADSLRAMGHDAPSDLAPDDLVPLSREAEAVLWADQG